MLCALNMAAERVIFEDFVFSETEVPTTAEQAWRRIIRHLLRVRALQRIWGRLGGFLRTRFPAPLRDRLRDI